MRRTNYDEAKESSTSPERLWELSTRSVDARRGIALNPKAPLELLVHLAEHHRDQEMLESLSRNPNIPPKTLLLLAEKAPKGFLENPALPLILMEHPSFYRDLPREGLSALLALPEVPLMLWELAASHESLPLRQW